MSVFTRAWWEAAGSRAASTAIAVLLPVAALLVSGDLAPVTALSMTAVAVVASLATSLAGLPEVRDRVVPLWRAVVSRTLKTAGQSLAAALVGVELIEAVDWNQAAVVIGGAVLTTLLRTLAAYLPETEPEPVPPLKPGDEQWRRTYPG